MANTIIFDLDGTLADINKRRDMSKKIDGSMDWDSFFHPSHISFDLPNPQVIKSAQLFKAAHDALPDLNERIAAGDFTTLLGWLVENVHSVGSAKTTDEIISAATGAPLSADAFLNHLSTRYL